MWKVLRQLLFFEIPACYISRYGHTIVTVAVVDIYSACGISCCHRDRCRVRNPVHHTHHHHHQTER